MSAVEGKSKVSKEKFKRREVVKITVIRSVDFSDWFVGLERYSALSMCKIVFRCCLFVCFFRWNCLLHYERSSV